MTCGLEAELTHDPPAMQAGVTDRLWDVSDIVALVEAADAPAKKRGSYKRREEASG